MSTSHQLLLSLAYVLPIVLLTLILLRADIKQSLKVILLIGLPIFYLAHFHALRQLLGWPSTDVIPTPFTLLGHQIVQPDKRTDAPGSIVLWAYSPENESSRLYRLPYSRDLHQQLIASDQRKAKGKQQRGTRESGSTSLQGAEQGGGDRIKIEDDQTKLLPPKTESNN